MEKELIKGSIDIILLALISKKDLYGYALAKEVKQITNNFYKISEGTLYPALKRLEEKDYINSFWGEADEGARRKYYSITITGREELVIRLNYWNQITEVINKCVGWEVENE